MRSNIKPLGRFLVLALLAKVDNETAVIPPDFTPSLSTLAAATGLAKSAVAEHLKYVEDLGWVKRSAPARRSRYDRTQYALLVGRDDPARPSGSPRGPLEDGSSSRAVRQDDSSGAVDDGPAVRGEDYSAESSCPPHGPPVVRQEDSLSEAVSEMGGVSAGAQLSATRTTEVSCPPHGHASTKNLPTKSTTKKKTRKSASTADGGTETEGQRVNRLARVYTDIVKLSNFNAVAGVVRVAVRAKVPDERITKGLVELASVGRSVTTDSLRYAIYGVPPSQFKSGAPATNVYRNPSDQDEYDAWPDRRRTA